VLRGRAKGTNGAAGREHRSRRKAANLLAARGI
jgi:hypothetical protein